MRTLKTFGELDKIFLGTSLENEEFWFWRDESEEKEWNKIKDEAYKLVKIYDKYKDKINLHYPAYYVKGKNGPYYNSICLQPNGNEDKSYSHYEGQYCCCYVGHIDYSSEGEENNSKFNIDKLFLFSEIEKDFLNEIESIT